jgi:Recombination endonuclease VII
LSDFKQCPGCGAKKRHDEFRRNAARPDGLSFYCKACFKKIDKDGYRRRRETQGFTVRTRVKAPKGWKWCADCGQYQRLSDFYRNKASRDGYNSYCRVHHNERGRISHFSRTYGITAERVERMIEGQGGLCPICGRDLGTRPHVDHDHETGAVRGILCFNCNGGLGQFGDDIDRLQQAVEYLKGNLQPSAQVAIQAEQRLLELLDRFGRAA